LGTSEGTLAPVGDFDVSILQEGKAFEGNPYIPALSDILSESLCLRICNSLLSHKIFLVSDYKSLNNLLSDNISERAGLNL